MKTIFKGLAVATLALGLAAKPARADIASSMTATVQGSDIIFLLSATQPGTYWLSSLAIYTAPGTGWKFDEDLSKIEIREGSANGVLKTSSYPQIALVRDELTFLSGPASSLAQAALAPIWIKVGLATTGTSVSELGYHGEFFDERGKEDFEGHVTPEPMTVLLLGTGLLGIAVVALRRRRESGEMFAA